MSEANRGRTFGLEDEPKPIGPEENQESSEQVKPFREFLKEKGEDFLKGRPVTPKDSLRRQLDRMAESREQKKEKTAAAKKIEKGKEGEIWVKEKARRDDIVKMFRGEKGKRGLLNKTGMKERERKLYAESLFKKTSSGYVRKETLKKEYERLKDEHSKSRREYQRLKKASERAKIVKEREILEKKDKLLHHIFGKPKK